MDSQEIYSRDSTSERIKSKIHKCSYCNRKLSSRQCLREHTYTHTGEKPYKCTELGCTKSYRQGSLLTIHKKVHEGILNFTSVVTKKREKSFFPQFGKLVERNEEVNNLCYNEQVQEIKKIIRKEDFEFIRKFLE